MKRVTEHTTTARIPADLHEEAKLLSEAAGMNYSDALREALREWVQRKRADKKFMARVRDSIERNKAILDRLAE